MLSVLKMWIKLTFVEIVYVSSETLLALPGNFKRSTLENQGLLSFNVLLELFVF